MPEPPTPARDARPAESVTSPAALPPSPHREPEKRGLSATFSALHERDFAWYFAGNIAFFMAMQMQMLLRGFLAFELTDAATVVEGAKSIKSVDELALIHRSVTLTEAAMTHMEAALRPGMSENELWSIFNQHVLATGGEYAETRLLSSGARTNPWFQECSDKIIAPGELVAFDTDIVGCFGYYTDFSRTFHVPGAGAPNAEQKALYRMAADQLERNIALLRPGMSFRDYSRQAWPIPDGYRENRYLDIVHGCGMTGEWPLIAHDMDWDDVGYDGDIEPGMTLCVEAYIGHRDGTEGVKLEEQVLITEDGIDRLSTYGYSETLMAE